MCFVRKNEIFGNRCFGICRGNGRIFQSGIFRMKFRPFFIPVQACIRVSLIQSFQSVYKLLFIFIVFPRFECILFCQKLFQLLTDLLQRLLCDPKLPFSENFIRGNLRKTPPFCLRHAAQSADQRLFLRLNLRGKTGRPCTLFAVLYICLLYTSPSPRD